MASEGLVELLPNRGARVTRLTVKKVRNTYDVMAALEGLSGELACRNISDEKVATIQRLHETMLDHYRKRDLQPYFRVNQQIHEHIIAAADNDVLEEMYNNLSQRVKRVRYSKKMTEDYWKRAVEDHEAMIEALQKRDGPMLGRILREHLCNKLEVASLEGMIEEEEDELPSRAVSS
ncbi:GntR family transcriptional regulator [Modicisalibacter luteus]